ncbi:MAG: hemerythrin family protein [Rhodospirillales bacterium]|jgi:hemerythrin|nr:hemerythrin family protein [Rhodospirillales bacterium]
MPIVWSQETMSIGLPSIDADHQKLLALINEVEAVALQRLPADVIERVLAQLAQYVSYHFRREEEMMAKAGFPGLTEHEGLHEEFSDRVCQLTAQYFIDANLADAKELLDFLSNWLVVHIQSRDPEFVSWVKGAAVDGAA